MSPKLQKKNDNIAGQQLTGNVLEKNTQHFRELFDNMLEGVQVLDKDWRYLYLNAAAEKHNRRPNQELLGRKYMDMWPGIEETHVFSLIERCMDEGVASKFENRFVYPDKMVGWFALSVQPISESVLILSFDITERVRAERQVVQMKRLYATLSQVNQTIVRVKEPGELYRSICNVAVQFGEFSLAWIGLLDEDTGEVNPVAAEGLDINHWPFPAVNIKKGAYQHGVIAQAIKKSNVVTSEDLRTDERIQSLHSLIRDYDSHSMAVIPFRLDGRVIGVLCLISPEAGFFKSDDEIRLLDEMGLDISFALDTMEMERVKRQWADAFEQCAHGMAIGLPSTSHILTCNPAFARLQGRSVEEISSMPILSMYAPQDHVYVKQSIAEADETGRVQFEAHMIRKDGSLYPVQMDIVSVRDEQGNLLYRVATQQDISERKQSEAELRKNEEKYRFLFESNPHPMWVYDMKTLAFLAVNDAAIEKYGFTLEEFQEMTLADIRPAEDVSRLMEDISRQRPVLQHSGDWRHRLKDGTVIEVEITSHTLQTGNHNTALVVAQDITKRKQAEIALAENEQRFRALTEHAPDGIVIYGSSARIEYASPVTSHIMGYSTDEIIGADPVQMTHPDDLPGLVQLLNKLLQSPGETLTTQYRMLHKDGSWRWLESNVSNFSGIPGIGGLVFNFRDITERKQAEEALLERETRFRSLIENGSEEISIVDAAGKLLYESPTGAPTLGYRPGEFLDQNIFQLIHLDDLERVREQFTRLIQDPSLHPREQFRLRHRNGNWCWVEAVGTNLLTEPSVRGIVINYHDITDRKQAEEALRMSENRFQLATRATNDVIWEWNARTHELIWSENAQIVFGYLPEQIGPDEKWWDERIHPDDRERIVSKMDALIAGNESLWSDEYRFRRRDDSYTYISDRGYIERDASGEAIRMVGAMSDISERKRAEVEIRQRVRDLETINRVSIALRASSNKEHMLAILLEEILDVMETQNGAISLWDLGSNGLRQIIARGWLVDLAKKPIKSGEGFFGTVFASGQTHLSKEFASDPITLPEARMRIPPRWGGVCVPIRSADQMLGVLVLAVPSERDLKRSEIRLLETLAEMTGTSLHRMSLHEETRRHLERLQSLRAIDHAIAGSFDRHTTFNILLEQTVSQLGVDAVAILLLNEVDHTLEYSAVKGFRTQGIRHSRTRLGEGFAGQVGLERKLLHKPNLLEAGSQFAQLDLLKNEGFVEYYGVPLVAKGLLKGVMEVFNRSSLVTDPEWMNYLETLGGQAAIAINSAELFEGMQTSNLELVAAYDATIAGWSHAMDLRDKETEGHTLRVTELTLKLAERMGISQQEQVHIRRGALLHDIGKLGIPDHILLKPGKLTEEEWDLMRQHPTYAFKMLSPISYLRSALDIPYCHHEKWDGTGYPRGLKGEQIPLSARAFAVVDVWDALRSDRPYRECWSTEKTRAYILEQSGAHFDPKVVEAFLPMIEDE